MATLGILCPPLPGHINPMAVLADELVSHGHEVVFLGFPDMEARLPAGTKFQAFGADEQPPDSLDPYLHRLGKLGSILSLRRLIGDLANFSDVICRTLPETLDLLKPDALIIDQTDAASSLVARALGLPFANVANALPLNAEPGVPPPVLPWPYDPSPAGIRRNLGGYRVARIVERPITKIIRRHAARFGQRHIRFADDTLSESCQITQCVKGLDFPREKLPSTFHYVGPFRRPDNDDIDLPDTGKPLVFCSLGTLQGSQAALFDAVAEAASGLDVELLITHGGMLDPVSVRRLERTAIVRDYVPQRAVLARAALAVTHAGFNTVMDALSFGVPMVALPIAFEQPGTAARLQWAGVAEVLHKRRSAERIGAAMKAVLSDGRYRAKATNLAAEIATAGGVAKAADLIERSLGLSAPTANATTAPAAPDGAHGGNRSGSR